MLNFCARYPEFSDRSCNSLIPLSSFSPHDLSQYIIYAGRYLLNGVNLHQTSHRVRRVVVAPGYMEPHTGADVALVELTSPVIWSDYVRPVCLPSSGILFSSGLTCTVTGWGHIRDSGKSSSVCFGVFRTLHSGKCVQESTAVWQLDTRAVRIMVFKSKSDFSVKIIFK